VVIYEINKGKMASKEKNKLFIFNMNQSQLVFVGLIMGISSILSIFYIDQPLTHWIHDSFQGSLDSTARIITWFGSGDTYFLISVCGYLLARLFSKTLTHLSWAQRLAESRDRFSFMFLSFLISGVIVLILKSIFGRGRPYQTPDFMPLNFKPFTLDWNFQSYPSGHTQVGFTLASFLSILYPKGTKYFFTFAIIVGLSRVILEKHYLGDVLAGGYIGILGTFLAWKWKWNGRK
jgi:membrane-associated phospholipid phosphatase